MKTAEYWLDEFNNSVRPHEAIIREIQQDARYQALSEAAEVVQTKIMKCRPENRGLECLCESKEAILNLRDNKKG